MKKINLLLTISGILVLCSCHKNNVASQNIQPDVYLAGYETIPGTAHAVATYWKNGVAVHLTDGPQYSEAHSIVVSGNDVYVAGYENTQTSQIALYWKNGIPVKLAEITVGGISADAIAVSGNNVYVAGTERGTFYIVSNGKVFFDEDYRQARCWINGAQINLTPDSLGSEAFSIAVSGNDVYVAGDRTYMDTHQPSATSGSFHDGATYWKNGVTVKLTDGLYDSIASFATGIVVSGPDVFVCGVQGYQDNPDIQWAKYWKNGLATSLTDNGILITYATGIAVSGNDVYVSGLSSNNGDAVYWKNGNPVHLDGSGTSVLNSITTSGNDIYIAGESFYVNPVTEAAKYWKNGVAAMTIDSSANNVVVIKSIYVANK